MEEGISGDLFDVVFKGEVAVKNDSGLRMCGEGDGVDLTMVGQK